MNPEPLGRCPFEEDCTIVESPTQFVCERKLKEAELTREERKQLKDEGAPQSCGFVFPRTVCKREITRDEALHYLREGKTELLTDFTSRFGRPFSATLVLKENGRHGFEFPPRKRAGEEESGAGRRRRARSPTAAPRRTEEARAREEGAPADLPAAARSRRSRRARRRRAQEGRPQEVRRGGRQVTAQLPSAGVAHPVPGGRAIRAPSWRTGAGGLPDAAGGLVTGLAPRRGRSAPRRWRSR